MAEFAEHSRGRADDEIRVWLSKVTELLAPSVDRMDQLPARASLIFNYDARAALAAAENAEVLSWPNTEAVFDRFTVKILEDESAKSAKLTPECFKLLVNEVKAETGAKGKELFHPIRIIVTGSHSGPEFDKLIPILEAGSLLNLARHVLSVCERVRGIWQGAGCQELISFRSSVPREGSHRESNDPCRGHPC